MSNLAAIVLFELPSVDSVCRRRQVRGFAHVALDKLVEAIAQFVQTQYCFDVERLREFMLEARELGLHRRCHILVGVGPLLSSRSALWMRNNLPGILAECIRCGRPLVMPVGAVNTAGRRVAE